MAVLIVVVAVLLTLALAYWLLMSSYSQVFGEYPWRVRTKDKLIALTFDDGPNEPYTSQIVEFLNARNIKATFFEVGKCVERYPETTKKIINSGHIIGNHSLSHKFYKYFLSLNFETEISKNQEILKKYCGKTPALYRSPWLWRSPFLIKSLRKYRLHPVSGVFCHNFEVLQIDGRKIAKAAIKKARPGAIIIFHDGFNANGGNRQETVRAVKIVVERLSKSGYSFVTVDQLLGVAPYQ